MTAYVQVDVFTHPDAADGGNPLAVFPEPGSLETADMQAIAHRLGLSETTFVTSARDDRYEVRIFTPEEELPFAGHPTLGTAWVLRERGEIAGDEVVQLSGAGETRVAFEEPFVWLRRKASSDRDIVVTRPRFHDELADALGIGTNEVGFDAREMGRSGELRSAGASAGLPHLIVPVRSVGVLEQIEVDAAKLSRLSRIGAYCVAPDRAGLLRARGLFPGLGVPEDPATGSAAAALGGYLHARVGDVRLRVHQGFEIGRHSELHVRTEKDVVWVGGRCRFNRAAEISLEATR